MQKHGRTLSSGSVGWSSVSEDLVPARYEVITKQKEDQDTVVVACWEHGQEEGVARGNERKRWRQVAIKVAKVGSASGRIDREAEILKALSGQNRRDFTLPVPRFYQRGQHQGRSLLCMELLGPNLEQVLGAEGSLDEALTYSLGARVVLNLFKIHLSGWIHGSVCPEKVLVGRGEDCGNIYLTGLSRADSAEDPAGGHPVGAWDLAYGNVTRLEGGGPTRVGDLWSAFYVLLECLVGMGRLPWQDLGSDVAAVLQSKRECLEDPALYVSKCGNLGALPRGLAALHASLRDLAGEADEWTYNKKAVAIVLELLSAGGEPAPATSAPADALTLDQIQWPPGLASTLTELSKMAGNKGRPQEFVLGREAAGSADIVVPEDGKLPRKGSGMLSGLVQTLSACLTPPAVFGAPEVEGAAAKEALGAVLDQPNEDEGEEGEAREMVLGEGQSEMSLIAESFYKEQKLRVQAEVKAKDKEQRLHVAQTQLVEYASQQARDAAQMKSQGDTVLGGTADPESAKLLGMIQQHEVEATAFYRQQCSDLEKAKPVEGTGEGKSLIESQEGAGPDQNGAKDEALVVGHAEPTTADDYEERAKYIPLRLSLTDRRLLRLLEAALNVSEYTDRVDVISYRSKHHRINQQLRDMCSILCGLVVAQNYKKGKELIEGKEFSDNAEFFQDVFEIGRRHKILNPEKMRSEYGKLLYMLMDSQLGEVQNLLEFKCVRGLRTVHSLLSERGALGVLQDQLIGMATEEIKVGKRRRHEVQQDIKRKEKAREMLAAKYASRKISKEEILTCLYSIGDNNSYLLYNRDPIDKMIALLQRYFKPNEFEDSFSLAITGGVGGARLSHSHQRQYTFVLQSLTLWREISHDMYKLWYLAESDILADRNRYTLADTGQGLNRIQRAPSVYNAMCGIISRCQRRIGSWVGSSVVHLGDHNVPNALMFIDKYTQVPRILNPIVLVIESIPEMARDPAISEYFDRAFGGQDDLVKSILVDFFRHGFDGSGADNFFDAGSCIDGRLTSAWNWCSKVEKKSYFPVFRLAGFQGFDGEV